MFEKEINNKFIDTKSFIKKIQHSLSVFDQIQIIRKFLGMSQKQLAKKSGLSQPNLSKIESGKENISLNTLHKLANSLNCDAHIILTPKIKLNNIIEARADFVAKKLANDVFKNIAYEGHILTDKEKQEKIDYIKKSLLENKNKLWAELND